MTDKQKMLNLLIIIRILIGGKYFLLKKGIKYEFNDSYRSENERLEIV